MLNHADCTSEAALCMTRVLTTDPEMGVIRQADATNRRPSR